MKVKSCTPKQEKWDNFRVAMSLLTEKEITESLPL